MRLSYENKDTWPVAEQFWSLWEYISSFGDESYAMLIFDSEVASFWDDSSSSVTASGHVLTMAGYIASIDNWKQFENTWDTVLKHFHVKHAHMTDFVAKQQEFEGWDEDKRREFLIALSGVIADSNLFGVSANVHIEALERANKRWRLSYSAYAVAAVFVVHAIRAQYENESIHIFIDRVKNGGKYLHEATEIVHRDPLCSEWWDDKEAINWQHLTKKQMEDKPFAIEAADFHAWESRAYAETKLRISERGKGSHWSGMRHSFVTLLEAASVRGGIHSDVEIDRLFRRLVAGTGIVVDGSQL